MGKAYRCQVDVRGYELDSYGHVNHAVYLSYLEHARWKLLESEGITLKEFGEWKRWPIVASLEVNYLKPTFMGDVLEIRSEVVEKGRTNFIVEHSVVRGDVPVLRAKVRIVTVNEAGRPAELPEGVARIWT
jgi:YbgC/YbaW family acyl-CoA thioester hydrolase